MAYIAPFETFKEHAEREACGQIYNETFITRCREKALEYDKLDKYLRPALLRELKRTIPMHYGKRVFDGIKSFD